MAQKIVCMIVGHRQYSAEVVATRPWQDRDFYDYAQEDFREPNCLRCGEPLQKDAA